jgi:hypothetical protein
MRRRALFLPPKAAFAGDWPQFRGPSGLGVGDGVHAVELAICEEPGADNCHAVAVVRLAPDEAPMVVQAPSVTL